MGLNIEELKKKWAQSFRICCDDYKRDPKTDRCVYCSCVEVLHDFKELVCK